MKLGDIVRLIAVPPHWSFRGFKIGDIAILIKIDWEIDERNSPVYNNGMRIDGRGRFYFPNNIQNAFRHSANPPEEAGYMATYNYFEVI